jgi:hypothetical protein
MGCRPLPGDASTQVLTGYFLSLIDTFEFLAILARSSAQLVVNHFHLKPTRQSGMPLPPNLVWVGDGNVFLCPLSLYTV